MSAGVIVLNQPDLSALVEAGEISKEAAERLSEIVDKLADLLQGNSLDALNDFLEELKDMMSSDALDKLLEIVNGLLNNPNIVASGRQMGKGRRLQIPAVTGQFSATWRFDTDIYITGIKYSQSAWKYQDYWNFQVGNEVLLDEQYTKEVAEYKHFNRYELVKAGTEIVFTMFNNSGNSRDLWVDLEYLGVAPAAPPPDISTDSSSIFVELWDNSAEDNDTIDIYLNGNPVAENFVAANAHKTIEVDGLTAGNNVLRFEAKQSDSAHVSVSALFFAEDGTTPIVNNKTGDVNFSININVPAEGVQSEPYPYIEWEVYRA